MSRRRCCCDCEPAADCTTCDESTIGAMTAEVIVAGAGDCGDDCAGLCDAINATYFPAWQGPCEWTWGGDGTDFDGYCPAAMDTPCLLGYPLPDPPPYVEGGPGYLSVQAYQLALRIDHVKSAAAKATYGFATECNTRVSVGFHLCTGYAIYPCTGIVGIGFCAIKWIEGRVDCADITGLAIDDELYVDGPCHSGNPCGWLINHLPFVNCDNNVPLVHTWDGETWDGREDAYDGDCSCAGYGSAPAPLGGRHACDFSGLSVTVSLT